MQKFYQLEGQEDDEEEADFDETAKAGPSRVDYARGQVLMESSDESDAESSSAAEDAIVTIGPSTSTSLRSKHKAKRPKSSTNRVNEDDDGLVNLDESEFADLDAQAEFYSSSSNRLGFGDQARTTKRGDETRRIAVVNLDWDHIKAAHLYKVFSSALGGHGTAGRKKKRIVDMEAEGEGAEAGPIGGKVLNVTVYPSEFGKARMIKEDLEGPPKVIFAKPDGANLGKKANILLTRSKENGSDDDEDLNIDEINERTIFTEGDVDEYDQDELRKYQLERLRQVCEDELDQTADHRPSDISMLLSNVTLLKLPHISIKSLTRPSLKGPQIC